MSDDKVRNDEKQKTWLELIKCSSSINNSKTLFRLIIYINELAGNDHVEWWTKRNDYSSSLSRCIFMVIKWSANNRVLVWKQNEYVMMLENRKIMIDLE